VVGETRITGEGACATTDNKLELLRVLPFFVPGHLDGFEFAFVRACGIAVEGGQFRNVAVQIGKTHRQWIGIRKFFCEYDAEILSIFPTKISRHWTSLVAQPPSAVLSSESQARAPVPPHSFGACPSET